MTELVDREAALQGGPGVLVDAVVRLSLARTVEDVQEIVRHAARQICGADGATFVMRDGARCHYVDEDAISPLWKGQKFPLETCISGWAMLNRQAARIPDIYQDDRIPHDAYRPTFVQALAMVPIRRLDPIGAIGNYWSHEHETTDEELALLQALADSTAVALENVKVWDELEMRVIARTEQLAQAAKLNEQLLHTLAHEVRNPLAATDGLLDMVLDDAEGLDDTQREDIEHARSAVQDGLRIVTEQLDLAKLKAGAVRVQPEAVDPAPLLASLAGTFRALRQGDGVALVVEEPVGLPTLLTDPHLVNQILRNLLTNALKFTDAGEVRLRAFANADRSEVSFVVSDTGVGIAPEAQAKVFEEFAQVDEAQGGRRPGTGLGLPWVKRLAELLGGGVTLQSAPGEGSTFTVTLPAAAPEPADL